MPNVPNNGDLIQNRDSQYAEFIHRAFEDALQVLGESGIRLLMTDLEFLCAYSRSMPFISLGGLMVGLREVLGDEAAEMIMERIIVRLDALYSTRAEA
jgi:hypothetical protein